MLARRHRQLATEVNDRFTDSVAELDPHALWVQLRRWTHRVAPLRFVALRDSRAAIRAAAMPGMLETDGAMITALEAVIAERAVRAALLAAAEPARRWFGELGGDPLALDLGRIDAAVTWAAELRLAFDAVEIGRGDAGRAAAWRALVAQVAANPAGDSPASGELGAFSRLAEEVARWTSALAELAEATGIAAPELGAGSDHLSALGAQIESLRGALDGMRDWVAFHAARQAALAEGVGPAVAAVERGELPAAELAQAWERATLLSWADAEIAATPALAEFHGATHHAQVAAFADLDRATLALLRSRALVRLAERVPRATIRPATRSGTSLGADPGGELGALVQEIRAQHGHRPLRQLFSELPTLLPSIAPCLLMPPLAVAQHLDPARPRFDVVVFDEASQLPTAEAIGALARGNTAVIVGDRAVADPDSLLADAIAAGLPTWRLECHYRSRHEDLIAFACQRTHGDRLQVFPAAGGAPDLGVSWRHVEGIDLRAGARCNRIEAEAVVAEVLARLRDPAQRTRSIAIVALSREQRELIEDLLDDARASAPELDRFFEPEPERGECAAQVIVETIEAIRGDQRDVAIVSVGAIAIDLGVLSQHGGERWLSIATTRAREQLIVFSSVAPEDLAHAVGQGAQDLAALLAFARAGGGAARAVGGAEPASPIAAAIAHALVERGWTVHHQVGCSAYKIDLAVVDPGDAARYVLAIETDGAAYASAAAARDRDRLRAQMLGQLGWRVHRIWALDWWTDPEREVQRAHTAIVTAVAASRQRRAPARTGAAPLRSARIAPGAATAATAAGAAPAVIRASRNGRAEQAAARDRSAPVASASSGRRTGGASAVASGSGPTDAVTALLGDTSGRVAAGSAPVRIAKNTIAIGPYLAAAIPAGRRAPDDLFAPRHHGELGKIIDQVLAAEAPMHIDVLARRVGAYFGFGRPTPRVIERVSSALEGRGRWGDEDGVVWRLDQDPAGVPPVRVAGQVASARRDIAEVPLAEVAAAARIVVERAAGIAAGDLVRDAARLLGFARLTDPVVQRVASGVRLAAQRDLIRIDGGKAMLPD